MYDVVEISRFIIGIMLLEDNCIITRMIYGKGENSELIYDKLLVQNKFEENFILKIIAIGLNVHFIDQKNKYIVL
jgi:hypothetical protein